MYENREHGVVGAVAAVVKMPLVAESLLAQIASPVV
jgi:hypothetical protein